MKSTRTHLNQVQIVDSRLDASWLSLCVVIAACSSSPPPLTAAPAGALGTAAGPSTVAQAGQSGVGSGAVMPPVSSAGVGASGVSASGASGVGAAAASGTAGALSSAGRGADSGVASADSDAGPESDMGTMSNAGSGGSAGASPPVSGPPPTAADYAKLGPYGKAKRLTNQGRGTVTGGTMGTIGEGGDDPSAFTLFFPQSVKPGERFPLLTWGNGTFCSPTLYDELMNFIVSYGYVVVASNTSNAGTGAAMLKGVEWAIAESNKADSPIHGLVDPDKVGAFGHSQGGEGAVNAAADPRIRAVAPLSAGPMGSGEAKIQCPAFYTLTANDVVPPESYRASYDATTTPSAYGVTKGGDHMEYTDKADGLGLPGLTSNDAEMTRSAITAWFEFQLKGKKELQPLFVGKDCGFCKDANWKSFESKGF